MICTRDHHQLLRLGKRLHKPLQFRSGSKLIAVTAHEQLGFHAALQKLEIINSIINRSDWQTQPDHSSHARVGTGHTQSHRRPKREAREDQRQMKFAIQPFERSPNVLLFCVAMVVLALAQSGTAKIKAQHRITKTVQRLHGVKNDFVVESSSIERMRMAHERSTGSLLRTHIEQGFQPSGWTVEEQRFDRRCLGRHVIQITPSDGGSGLRPAGQPGAAVPT
jgi:hypothetical protein